MSIESKYGIFYKSLKFIGRLCTVCFLLYTFYVLCTPGLYSVLAVCLCVIAASACIWLWVKKQKVALGRTMPKEENIEHEHALTYRKRFYNRYHIISCIILCAFLSVIGMQILIKQSFAPINNEYSEAVSFLLEDSTKEGQCFQLVADKLKYITPNPVKQLIINTRKAIDYASKTLSVVVESDGKDELQQKASKLKDEFNKLSNEIDNTHDALTFYIRVIVVVLVGVKITYKELLRCSYHKSIHL